MPETLNHILLGVASGGLILLGALGSVLPILPGPPISFAGLWLYAWYTNYEVITPTVLIVFGVLTLLTFIIDIISPALGARGYKSSSYGVIGSMVGAFAGVFILGPIGVVVGPFIGAFIGELIHARNYEHAGRVAWGSFVGFMIGSVFKIVVILAMFGYFIYSLF